MSSSRSGRHRAPDRPSAAIAPSSKTVLIGMQLDAGAVVELARRARASSTRVHRARAPARRGSARGCRAAALRSIRPKSTPHESTATESTWPARARPREAVEHVARRGARTSQWSVPPRRPARSGSGGPRSTRQTLAVEPADGDAPALGAEVDGGERRHQSAALVVSHGRAPQIARPDRRRLPRPRIGGDRRRRRRRATPRPRRSGALESVTIPRELLDRHERRAARFGATSCRRRCRTPARRRRPSPA